MKAIKCAMTRCLIVAVLITMLFPAGGVLLGVGLSLEMTAVWGTGIACIVFGFYACPVAWSSIYAAKRPLYRLVDAVENERLYTVTELANHLNLSEKVVRYQLNVCIDKRYLRGYKREGDRLVLNTNKTLGERNINTRCPNCGASFTYRAAQDSRCPYCGSFVSEQ